jgi:methylaspartate mutase epsilon subunit
MRHTAIAHHDFGDFIARRRDAGELIVQPRMGFSAAARMRRGLLEVKRAAAPTIGTITLDSYTRVNDHAAARRCVDDGTTLNGYPLVAHGAETTRAMLGGLVSRDFPVQVRHGSADPRAIFETMLAAGVHVTEGGPVSYCLPYSRMPLRQAVDAWSASARLLADQRSLGIRCHVETFGGCLLGQLCPPSLLVAVSLLEGMFFRSHGVSSVSLSYAQQTNAGQDREAIAALRRLARRFLPATDWHIVVYTYMGVYPSTVRGAQALLDESVRLAAGAGAERLIVKTTVEASRIPTIGENVAALERAAAITAAVRPGDPVDAEDSEDSETYAEASALVEAVIELHPRLDRALVLAFAGGLLDIPFCLHPDNRNDARSVIGADGRLDWLDTGRLPLGRRRRAAGTLSADELLRMLAFTASRFDRAASTATDAGALGAGSRPSPTPLGKTASRSTVSP